ncbi:MAG: heme exporter protein CcmD [Gammaproteobacteria bacterium]|jgi:heme exporter protein D
MIAEFFSMGGFGFFIWSSFGLTFLLMLGEILYLRQQRRTNLKRIQRIRRMNAGSAS